MKAKTDIDSFVQKSYLDEDDRAVIDVSIDSLHGVLSPFCSLRQSTLNPEVTNFIDAQVHPLPLKYPVRINFIGSLAPSEKEGLRQLFQAHYCLRLLDKKRDIRLLYIKAASLTLLGLLFLVGSFAVQSAELVFPEILSILGSFALWEAADALILERRALRLSYYLAGRIAVAEVDFSQN